MKNRMRGFRDLRLQIEQGREPISGILRPPDGRAVCFEGYMELVTLIEGQRGSAGPSGGDPPAIGEHDAR